MLVWSLIVSFHTAQGWTQDVSKADAAWFNVLEHNQAAANSVEYLNLGEMPLKVFMSLESKEYYPDFVTAKSRGLFDYIVDYRIWSSNTNPSGDNVADIPAVYLLNPTNEDTAIDFRKPTSLPKRNDAYIAAFISNCASRNGREVYMEQLMKYIPFHSYGRCHHTMDEPSIALNRSNREKKLMIGREYYFWFTAENSNSDSYVTEKVYEALEAGVVPVYFGAPNIERFIPDPSAIIMADRYEPKDLADLLKRIASDPAEYATYFEWKSKPFSKDFTRVLKLASRTVQCRLAMHLEGLDMERD